MPAIYKTEAEIIAGCKANNREAQKALYKSYVGGMNAACYRYTKSYDDTRDIVHDCCMIIFEKIHTYSGTGALGAWIRQIVVNRSIDFIKRKGRTLDIEDDTLQWKYDTETYARYQEEENDTKSELEIFSAQLCKEDILKCINQLDDTYRLVFNMYVIDGYSHKNIADALQITEETSRIRLKRSRMHLQKILLKMVEKTKLS